MFGAALIPFCVFAMLILIAISIRGKKWTSISRSIPGPVKKNFQSENLKLAKIGISQYVIQLHEKYGPIVTFTLNDLKVVSIGGPHLYKQHQHLFDRSVELFMDLAKVIGTESIQLANGQRGKFLHKNLSRPFSFVNCDQYYPGLRQLGSDFVDKLDRLPKGTHIPVQNNMFIITIKTVMRLLFGFNLIDDDFTQKIIETYKLAFFDVFYGEDDNIKVDKETSDNAILEYRNFIRNAIEQRLKTRHLDNISYFLDDLLDLGLNEDEEIDNAVTFFTGGFHTIGFLMTWLLYYMAKFPEIQTKVRQELEVLQDGDVSNDNISKLTYLQQVINETLRHSCLGPLAARSSDEDIILDGYTIPAKTPVIHCLGFSMVDPTYWSSPTEFDPNRFSPENSKNRPSLSFTPFGFAGKRVCPGYKFANMMVMVLTSIFVRRFKWHLVDGQNIQRVIGFVTRPSSEIWLTVEAS